ncbi:MAG: uracil phosphoribosyltransferase [Actinomycetota bacterium]|nr:MAG: uracil phosphoribosyltransferase [Actinomycetota bacterium]
MSVTVVDHPLAEHLLTSLRDRATPPPVFRTLAKRLALALALEAIRDLPTTQVAVETPLERTTGRVLGDLVAVPILRAGLGMLEAVTELFPEVAVGYIGLERDEASLQPQSYYRKLPPVDDRHVLILDPMLATGGSGSAACDAVKEAGSPATIRFVCVVAAPEGVGRLQRDHPDVPIFTASLDRELNDRGYILPGLGDFGDRLFGTE